MKNYIIVLVLFGTQIINAQLRLPAQSPSATIKQTIGLTEVEISYSRPSARERKIFGDLLPYNEFWRVGANSATKITFSKDVLIEEKVMKKGTYTILAMPGEKTWKLNWYAHTSDDWNDYVEARPVLNLALTVKQRHSALENLELHFQDITMDSATLLLEWERSRLEIPIRVDEEERILKSIDKTLSGPGNFDYYFAALYLHESQMQLNKALKYIQKVTNSEEALFFQVTREALILQDLERTKEAKKVAERALALSQEAGNKDFVRMNLKIINQ